MYALLKEEIAEILGKKTWSEENFLIDRNSVVVKKLKLKTFSLKKIQDTLKGYGIQKLRFEFCSFCDSVKIDEQDRGDHTLFGGIDFIVFLSIDFYECIFEKSLNLSEIYFEQGLGIYCSEFKGRVNFGKSIFGKDFILFDITANHHFSLLNTIFCAGTDIESCYFDKNLNFSSASFNVLYCRHSCFKEINFSNARFIDSVLFKNCQFDKSLLLEGNFFTNDHNFCFIDCIFNEYVVLDAGSEKKYAISKNQSITILPKKQLVNISDLELKNVIDYSEIFLGE